MGSAQLKLRGRTVAGAGTIDQHTRRSTRADAINDAGPAGLDPFVSHARSLVCHRCRYDLSAMT
jgi:hypothetical protein